VTHLIAQEVSVSYSGRRVLNKLTFEVDRGEWLGIIGPNGAGKSTLLRCLVGLVPHEGSVQISGTDNSEKTRKQRAQELAYVPQAPVKPPGMTVREYIALGRSPHLGYFAGESQHDASVVAEVIEVLDLASLAHRDVATLSGGEAQRAALGRALAQRAAIIVLDEPTASLDVGVQQDVLQLIEALRARHELTVITTMHDLTTVGQYADRLLLLSEGSVVDKGSATEVLTPANIARYYGANVRVEHSDTGVVVIPVRPDLSG
jgi:iron complex transport system ATP-binding protein